MSFFSLPTQSAPQETGISSVRVDEITPVSSVNALRGGSVAFEMQSPANSYFVPRMSYFNCRIRITKSVAGVGLDGNDASVVDYSTSPTGGGMQFKSNPIAGIVNTFSHMLNGVTVETCSNVAETAAILHRASISHEYLRSSGGSMYRLVGYDGARNSVSVPPGGSLQPWNGTTVHDCAWAPPSGMWSMPGGLPGGRHRMTMVMNTGLRERILQMGAVRAALTTDAFISVSIGSITLHATHMTPDQPIPVPRNVVLSLHPMTVVMSGVTTAVGNSTHTLSVPPSTDRLFVALNLQSAGSSCAIQDNHCSFEPSLSQLQVSYAGLTLPQSQYTSIDSGSAKRQILKPYADWLAASGRLYYETSSYDNIIDYQLRPIYGFSFEKAANDSSTNVQVRLGRTANVFGESTSPTPAGANLIVAAQSHIAVVLTYSDDGLISSCDSVVEL